MVDLSCSMGSCRVARSLPAGVAPPTPLARAQISSRRCQQQPPRQRGGAAAAGGDGTDELPEALKGLALNAAGDLVDASTGAVVNEFGATRFDVAVRAMRGEFSPEHALEDNERSSGVLLDSLVQWPRSWPFQVVLKAVGRSSDEALEAVRAAVSAALGGDPVPASQCTVKERLGGKFFSVTVVAQVRAAAQIDRAMEAVAKELGDTVMMKF